MEPRLLRALLAAAAILCAAGPSAHALTFNDKGDPEALAGRIAAAMSSEELLGQVFFLGWQGVGPSEDLLRWIGSRGIGGVKIFPRNVSDLPSLARDIDTMQKRAASTRFAVPLFVATDQEGGWVRQIKDETSVSPGNLALGASGSPGDAYLTGYYLGRELAALGINMDFAPTADVYSNPEASVIGPRSFGSDPAMTGLMSAAYARGMKNAGVVCTAKHFPGHGSADQDSHGHLPKIDVSLDRLLDRDLVPYRMLIREGIPAIMTGHLAFPKILGSLTPASLSPFFLQSVLRDRLGFQGIVITDDMEMEGVLTDGLDTPAACRRALEAGNDMVLVSHTPATQERTWDALIAVMRSNPAFRASVRTSATRILKEKLRSLRGADVAAPAPPSEVRDLIPAAGAKDFFAQVSARAVTRISEIGSPSALGRRKESSSAPSSPSSSRKGPGRYPGADTLLFPFAPFYGARSEDKAAVRSRAPAYDTVIFCLANYNSLDVLQELKGMGKKVIVISALSPVYLAEAPWIRTALAVYGDGRDSFRAGFSALAGDFEPGGTLPVSFPSQGGK